jgi:hypothetical protein
VACYQICFFTVLQTLWKNGRIRQVKRAVLAVATGQPTHLGIKDVVRKSLAKQRHITPARDARFQICMHFGAQEEVP